MRRKTLMIIGLMSILLLLVFFATNRQREFDWNRNTSFRHADDEPFGSQLFDSIAGATLPNGYSVVNGDLDEVLDTIGNRRSLLVVGVDGSLDYGLVNRLDSFVRSGNKLMLVAWHFQSPYVKWGHTNVRNVEYFQTTLLMESLVGHNYMVALQMRDKGGSQLDVSYALANSYLTYMGDIFEITSTIQVPDTLEDKKLFTGTSISALKEVHTGDTVSYVSADSLGGQCGYNVVSARCKIGRGEVHVVTSPLLFTNFGALDKGISRYLSYQLSQIADYPIVRVEEKEYDFSESDNKVSPLYYMLNHRPLRWALYVLLAAVMLFMLFTAKRRQRVIPPDTRPVNRNVQFVEMLGLLYFQRHDNRDMLSKKYTYFKEEIRRRLLLDFGNEDEEAANVRKLAQTTGIGEEELAGVMHSLRLNTDGEADTPLDDSELTYLIDKMDKILRNI